MFGDVNVKVEDGNLGRSSSTGTGTSIKIGISNVESKSPILISGTMNAKKIKEKVGNTPLADACIDAVEWGASSIYCIPVKAGTAGTIGKITEDQKGYGTFEVKGSPNNAYDIVVEVMDAGECNEGSFRYSLDGGNTFTEEMTIPITGEAELATTGLTAKFTDAEGGDSFMEGDRFTFSTTSPAMSNESVISAVESLINSPLMFEFVHIVGVSSKALWASLCTIANDFLTKYKRPLFFVCEARGKKADESLEDYVNAMLEERKGINNIYMQVVCSNSRYQRMDGRVQDINNAGIVTGLYGRVKLGGIYLEGQVTSVEVQEAGSVYVAQDEKGRYKKSQPVGYENAKVMIDILLEDTKTATTLEQLTEMQRLFKPYGQDKPKLLPIVNEDCAVRGITKVYFKSLTSKKVISESKRIASLELWAPDIAGIKVKKKTTKKKTTKKSTKRSKSKKSKSKSPAKDSRNTSRGKKAARAAVK